jgi:DNA invertase Pin-like site-specific DNA recombinase
MNHGLANVVWYEDVVSGVSDECPGFERLQKAIFNGEVGTVVVWKLDRIGRKGIWHSIEILTDWLDKGVRIVSANQQLDFTGKAGQLITPILCAIATMESTECARRTVKEQSIKPGKRSRVFAGDIMTLLRRGLSMTEVVEELGISRQRCYAVLQCDGVDVEVARSKAM